MNLRNDNSADHKASDPLEATKSDRFHVLGRPVVQKGKMWRITLMRCAYFRAGGPCCCLDGLCAPLLTQVGPCLVRKRPKRFPAPQGGQKAPKSPLLFSCFHRLPIQPPLMTTASPSQPRPNLVQVADQ